MVVEGVASEPSSVLSGVPQGTVLGPLFFLVYINDIAQGLSKGTVLKLFDDDSLLYRVIKSPRDREILQRDLDLLQNWEKKWKMEFHPGKCQHMKITNKKDPLPSNYFIHGVPISITDSAKYLGVVIDAKLKWKQHYSEILKKCNGTLAFIRRNLNKAPKNIKAGCYTALVRPRAEYASAVWDPHHQVDIQNIEKIQKRAARFVTGNYKLESGNTEFNLNQLNWPSLEERRLQTKLGIFQKARLKQIDIPTDHLEFKSRPTRQGGEGQTYQKFYSGIDSHRYSFYPHTTNLWNKLPLNVRLETNIDIFKSEVNKIDLVSLKN